MFFSLYCHTIRQKSVTVFGMGPTREGEKEEGERREREHHSLIHALMEGPLYYCTLGSYVCPFVDVSLSEERK